MPPILDTITSTSNPWVRSLRHAGSRGTPLPGGFAIAESPHLLHEAIRSGIKIERVFVIDRMQESVAATLPPHRHIPLHPVSDRIFGQIATTSRSQGVLALVQLPDWGPKTVYSGFTVALDGVQDPGNTGTIVRSAEAFGASGIVFLQGSAAPMNPKALRASAGSLFRVPFMERISADQFLALAKDWGKTIYCAKARGGVPLESADLSSDAALVVGSETHGISPTLAAAATGIAIATRGVESLNASVAASIILHEVARRSARQ